MAKRAKAKSHAKASLPAHKPKRTGKSGIGPKGEDPTSPVTSSNFEKNIDAAVDGENLEIAGQEPPKKKGKGKQPRLAGMEDPEIEEIEDLAEKYADVRDERMLLSQKESKLKKDLLGVMKRLERESYVHNGVTVKIVHEKENIKVRVNKPDETASEE